jgi:hypothetical protein
MTVEEALKILDQVCAVHQGVRSDHVAMQQAMRVVTEAAQAHEQGKQAMKDPTEPDGNK